MWDAINCEIFSVMFVFLFTFDFCVSISLCEILPGRFECCFTLIFISNVPGIANQRARKGLHFIKYIVISCVVKPVHFLNLSTQNAPDCISERSNV